MINASESKCVNCRYYHRNCFHGIDLCLSAKPRSIELDASNVLTHCSDFFGRDMTGRDKARAATKAKDKKCKR